MSKSEKAPRARAPTRRDVLKFGLAGAGTLALPRWSFAGTDHFANATAEPHFFLQIVLDAGADNSYMFDARPLAMTKAGRIQNYMGGGAGEDPAPWVGKNGGTCLATSLTAPLRKYRDRFSIVNGVVMATNFDGHPQNLNLLFSGNPFGGESFIPHLNLAETGATPASLDSVLNGSFRASVSNGGGTVPLSPGSLAKLSAKLTQLKPAQPGDELIDFVRARLAMNASVPGRFATGSRMMLNGLDHSTTLQAQLTKIGTPDPQVSGDRQFCQMIADCFRFSISRSALWVFPELCDTHAPADAKKQPELFGKMVDRLATIFETFASTPYDSQRSMLDVTTIACTTEFGRTMRSLSGAPIDNTGTDHNPLSNSVLIGGKGIRGGLVVGASDLQTAEEKASPAHLKLDAQNFKAMGRPFDFQTMTPRTDSIEAFDPAQYLTVGSVINTVYAAFSVPAARYRTHGRDLPVAPVLHGLLA